MRRRLIMVVGLLLVVMGNLQVAFAHDVVQGDECTISAGEVIDGNVFSLCRTLTVSGEIDGNLYGAASTILIDGKVDGSLYLVATELSISGSVGGNIHFAGGVLRLQPTALLLSETADVMSLSLSTEARNARVPGSIISSSYQLVLDGEVGGEVSFWGSALTINSTVEDDVTAAVGNPNAPGVSELRTMLGFLNIDVDLSTPGLRVSETGMIDGQLRYEAPSEAEIAVPLPNAPIYTPVATQNDFPAPERSFGENLRDFVGSAIREFVGLALIGVVGLLFFPRTLQAPVYSLRVRPLSSFGVGLLTFIISIPLFFILVPLVGTVLVLVLALLQLSDLAVIAAIIVSVLDLGGAGLFYFTAIFISRVVVCLWIGHGFVRSVFRQRSERAMSLISLFIGAAVLALASSLPYVGFFINALAAFLGLGAMLTLTLQQMERTQTKAITAVPLHPEDARQLPPPIIEDRPSLGPGMDNLPEGFHWWK